MKLPFIPRKFRSIAYLLVILMGVLAVLAGLSTKKIWRSVPPSEVAPARDLELEKVELALTNLKSFEMKARNSEQTSRESTPTLFPEGIKEVPPSDSTSTSSFEPSSLAVVITQSSRGRSIYLDGVRIKRGDVVQGGMTVREFGPTYFVLEDSQGMKRRIDVTDRLSVVSKEPKVEVKK